MFFDGYIGAPPSSTVISAKAGAKAEENAAPPSAVKLMAVANAASRTVNMQLLRQTWCRRAAGSDEHWRGHLVRPGLVRAGPEKAESGGDSQAARVMIHPAGWEEAS